MSAAALPITGPRPKEFREKLQSRVMVADGAMGTVLYSKGVFINRCYDELNLSSPGLVRETHQEYVKAGAARLSAFGLAGKPKRINHAGIAQRCVY